MSNWMFDTPRLPSVDRTLGYINWRWEGGPMGLLPDTQNCGCACAGNAGNVTVTKRSRHASRTCVAHVPWCMPGSLTSGYLWNRRRGKNVPGIPGACATCNFMYLVRGSRGAQIVLWAATLQLYVSCLLMKTYNYGLLLPLFIQPGLYHKVSFSNIPLKQTRM